MQIDIENAAPDFSRAINNIPPIDTQHAITTILVSDGQTSVIGGIYVSQEQQTNDRTPGLHKVPLLGWLFRRNAADADVVAHTYLQRSLGPLCRDQPASHLPVPGALPRWDGLL